MKKILLSLMLCCMFEAFAVANTSHASAIPVRYKAHQHHANHHAHRAAKHHAQHRHHRSI